MAWTAQIVWDILSASVTLLFTIPLILYGITQNKTHLFGFLGMVFTLFISESIKHFLIGDSNPRPKGAMNCNMWCNNGNQEGKPGMPSSHSTIVLFFAIFYIFQTKNILIRFLLCAYAITVMASRYVKHCHTIEQIVTGAVLGLCIALITLYASFSLLKKPLNLKDI